MLRKSLLMIFIYLFLCSCAQQTTLPAGAGPQTVGAGKIAPGADELDGALLYQAHCASCHAPLEKSSKKQRTVSRIHSAIRHFSGMRYLDFLTIQQLQAIAEVLDQP